MLMQYSAKKVVIINSAHQLDSVPNGHPCSKLHGHSYKITIGLNCSKLDDRGMVLDFNLVDAYVKQFDNQFLNEFFKPTTTEVFCQWLWDGLERDILGPLNRGEQQTSWVYLDSVSVQETEHNVCTLTISKR